MQAHEEGSEAQGSSEAEGWFKTTHWSVVIAARDQEGTEARDALGALCADYWYPLYAFIRRFGVPSVEAEDLTQEFFYRFLEKDSLSSVTPANGKFRSFLLVCLKNFLLKQRERAQAARRGGGKQIIPLDAPEAQYARELANNLSPDILFERSWASTLLQRTLEDLRREYIGRRKGDWFEDLAGYLPGGQATASREELAARRQVSVGAIDVAIHRLRQRFAALLRQRVAQTVSTETEVDEELRHLMSVVGSL